MPLQLLLVLIAGTRLCHTNAATVDAAAPCDPLALNPTHTHTRKHNHHPHHCQLLPNPPASLTFSLMSLLISSFKSRILQVC